MQNKLITYKNLYKAYLACRQNKRKTINALKFEYDLEENLIKLYLELKNFTYKPGRSIRFVVTEPKPREIFAADFRDRIVHHLFVQAILPDAEKRFIYDSYACRVDKGTHKAVERLRQFIKSAGQANQEIYYGQLDIKTFFPSIDQEILFKVTKKLILKVKQNLEWKKEMLWLSRVIIFHNAVSDYVYKGEKKLIDLVPKGKSLTEQKPSKGLPIGNYTSQFFANLYLNELDQFIKNELRIKKYIRYVDDIVVISKGKDDLPKLEYQINNFLKERLDLELNRKKTKIKAVKNGVDFLGYFIKKDYSLVRRSVIGRMNKKLYAKDINKKKKQEALSSYFAHYRHANSYQLRNKIENNQLNHVYWPESISVSI